MPGGAKIAALAAAGAVIAGSIGLVTPAPATGQAGSRATTPVVIRDGVWYLRSTNTSGPADTSFAYGNAGDIALRGRWGGGGGDTPAVVRDAHWYLRLTNTSGPADLDFPYGDGGDWPLAGDWNGDGVDSPAVVRGATWYLRNSNSGGVADIGFPFGDAGDRPLVGDWDGDGVDTPAVVRNGVWYLRGANAPGVADLSFGYGDAGDRPVVGDWNGDGVDTPGVVRGSTWYLRNSNSGGVADVSFVYGEPTDALVGERPFLTQLGPGDRGPAVVRLQDRLEALGFWIGPKDGTYGSLTQQAVYAFDKYHGLPRDGRADEATVRALRTAGHVQAASTAGDVVEVDKARQVLFIVRGGQTLWAFNTSTGTEGPYTYGGRRYIAHTPSGRFRILREIDGWRESHLGRLFRPKYFTEDGVALHGSQSVPPYPASHGCVRVSIAAINYVWDSGLAPVGTPVWVY